MQLKKQAIRKSPTYNAETAKHGVHRNPADFNQRSNNSQRNRNAYGDTFDAKVARG